MVKKTYESLSDGTRPQHNSAYLFGYSFSTGDPDVIAKFHNVLIN